VAGEVSAMSSLTDHLDRYLELRRSVGYQLAEHGRLLPDFVRFAQSAGETTVRTQIAVAWAAGACSDGQRGRRLSMVRGFARYLTAFDPSTEIPPRGLQPDGQVRAAPHIYSQDEITRLMDGALALWPAPQGATIATLIGLMASTGLRTGETRRLDRSHVDLAGGQLTVGPALSAAFRVLRRRAQVITNARQGPAVLGDLRHTFAVATLLAWHQEGLDVQRQLPVLSAYLGHVNPRQTFWYLEATPELMALVAERLERSWEVRR
jgi:integrase/recombinase XerD